MMTNRKLALIGLTVAGIVVGLIADEIVGGVEVSLGNVLVAVLLSPLLVTIGGRAVSIQPDFFLIGGVLFWPIWGALAWRWLRNEQPIWLALLILAWSGQGFFQLIHRLSMVMSA